MFFAAAAGSRCHSICRGIIGQNKQLKRTLNTSVLDSAKICVIGASVMDCVAYVDNMPAVGETVLGSSFKTGFGGKGANQAVMAGILGNSTAMITKVNPGDAFGEQMTTNFVKNGVSAAHVLHTSDADTGAAAIMVDSSGNNQIAVSMGANNLISAEDVEKARHAISSASILVSQLEIPLEVNLAAMRIAREEGTPNFLNTAPARTDLPDELFSLADIICPNEPETEALTGVKVNSIDDAKVAAQVLMSKGCKTVILTLGSRGAMLVDADNADGTFVAATKVTALDTVGAGDCFCGAFAHFFTEGLPVAEAMRRACMVASISVTRAGTQSSYPTLEECKQAGIL